MPVTAKFSQVFYDRLGHQVADEMVDWFNQVDTASRSDLANFNELNFARFDAKLDQRVGEVSAGVDRLDLRLSARIAELDGRVSSRFDALEAKLSARFDALEAKLSARMDRLGVDLAVRFEHQQVIQLRWMVGMWGLVLIAVMGLWIRR